MTNRVDVFRKIRKTPPPELDIRVRRGIKRLKMRRFAGILSLVFLFSFSLGSAVGILLFSSKEFPKIVSVSVKENLKENLYPGVAPLRVEVEPEGLYSYRIYLNGDIYREGYTSKEIDDSIVISDPINYVDLEILDLIYGGESELSWFVYNF